MKHRTDIDGLRALAVLPILLFHANVTVFAGGYVGVDVFFVISGFLITSILAGEIAEGRFSVARFYVRRIRRLFPALVVVLAATLVAGFFLLLPDDLANLGASTASTVLFVSNMFFWSQSGYFDTETELKPLLHTWSLAVEEQFYVLFPLILVGLFRMGWNIRRAVWLLLTLSLAASLYMVRHDATAAFYWLPTRAFELLAGAVIALNAVPAPPAAETRRGRMLAETLATFGAALILFAIFRFDKATVFPGENALVPCLGAALIIHAGQGGARSLVARILSLPPLVFVGAISYSLYLWHWPLIVYFKYYTLEPLNAVQAVLAILASFAAAILSWRLVEQPFRKPGTGRHLKVFAVTGVLSALLAGTGFLAFATANDPATIERVYGARIARIQDLARQTASPDRCITQPLEELIARHCLIGGKADRPSVALIGDSFADGLTASIGAALKDDGVAVAPFVYYSCPSILGTARNEVIRMMPQWVHECRAYVERTFAEVMADPTIRFVIISNNYDWYLNRLSTLNGEPIVVADEAPEGGPRNADFVRARISSSIDRLVEAGKTVIFVGASPSGHEAYGAKSVMKRLISRQMTEDLFLPASVCDDSTRTVGDAASKAHGSRFVYVDVMRYFLKPQGSGTACFLTADLLPLTTDGSHLSSLVSQDVAASIRAEILAHDPTSP